MKLSNIISIVIILIFIVYLLFSSSKSIRRSYLVYVIWMFPFMDLLATPVKQGGFNVFDVITYISIIFIVPFSLKKPSTKTNSNLSYLLFGFFILLLLESLYSEFLATSLISLVKLCGIFFYAKFLIDECFEDPNFLEIVIKSIKVACIISLAFLALQLIFGPQVRLTDWLSNAIDYETNIRYPSYFDDPQKYGQFLCISSFLFLIENKEGKISFINIALFFLTVLAIFLTGARAAFSGLAAGLLIVLLIGNIRYKIAGILFLIVGYVVVMFYGNNFALFTRNTSVDEMADARFFYWRGAFKIFMKHPITGIGIGNYQSYVSQHSQEQYWKLTSGSGYTDHPESGYLKILVEQGVFGFMLALGFIIVPILTGLRSILFIRRDKVTLFLIASILSWLVAFVTVYSIGDVRIFIEVVTITCLLVILNSQGSAVKTKGY